MPHSALPWENAVGTVGKHEYKQYVRSQCCINVDFPELTAMLWLRTRIPFLREET